MVTVRGSGAVHCWNHLNDRVPRGATMLRQALDQYQQQSQPQLLAEYT
ncbi:hypothetical protein [Streptomyces sp. NBC_01718]